MHISRSAAVAATLGALVLAPSAIAAPDHSLSLDTTKTTQSVTGAAAVGFNTSWLLSEVVGSRAPAPSCGKDPNTMCETTLVHVTADNVGGGTLTLRIDGFKQYSDFDLKSFDSNAAGDMVKNLGSPKGDPTPAAAVPGDPLTTAAGDPETKAIDLGSYVDTTTNTLDAYFLAVIPYFQVPNDSYTLHATLATTPPVVDTGDDS